MAQVSGIVLATGTGTACAVDNGLDMNPEGIDFAAVLAGIAGYFTTDESNPSNSTVRSLPKALSHQAGVTGLLEFPGVVQAPEASGLTPVCQTSRPERVHLLQSLAERCYLGGKTHSLVAEGLVGNGLPEHNRCNARLRVQGVPSVEGGAEPVLRAMDGTFQVEGVQDLTGPAVAPPRVHESVTTTLLPLGGTAVDEVKPAALPFITQGDSELDGAPPLEEQRNPGFEIHRPGGRAPMAVGMTVPDRTDARALGQKGLPVEPGAETLPGPDAVPVAGEKTSKAATVISQPVKNSNPAFLTPEQPDSANSEVKPAPPVFGGQNHSPDDSLSPRSVGPFTGAAQRPGSEQPQFGTQDAQTFPREDNGPFARPASPDLPAPDRPKPVTAPADSDLRVRVTEVAPNGIDQVFRHAVKAGEPARVSLENLQQQFLHEVARRIIDLQGHNGVVRLQLQLDPPQLGSVAVKLTLAEHKLKVHFYALDAEVKDILVSTLPDLRAELGRMGLNLSDAHVFVGQEHGREPEQTPHWEEGITVPAVPVQAVEETTLAAEGVDLLV
ncbi:MAG: flagellar hook-length control protein FliK [Bacillota bacterium]